jgi:RNA polymerase sigma factor (sigma-70 family)
LPSDAELISRSRVGDQEAFVQLVGRHEHVVWAFLVRRVGRCDAEDLLGEVWVNAFASRASYDVQYPDARPWLFGIAHNTLRRHWRDSPLEDPVDDLSSSAALVDPWPSVDERMDGATVLLAALGHVRPDERDVLLLVVWEELSVADAARVLGIPAGTARRHLHEARQTLRDAPGIADLLLEHNGIKESM